MTQRVHPAADVAEDGRADTQQIAESDAQKAEPVFRIIKPGDATTQPLIRIWGKKKRVSINSLFLFSVHSGFRQKVLIIVEWFWFDNFVLFLIVLGSVLQLCYRWREPDDEGFNWYFNQVFERIFTSFFTCELVLKVIAWGFFREKHSYLRDPWNWLDFVVVISALVGFIPAFSGSSLSFLRVFKVLRPLRSLNKVPQMKMLVNTVLSSIPRLGDVAVMMAFLFVIIAITGLVLMDGIFYRTCRATPDPVLLNDCWHWPFSVDDSGKPDARLCGGSYDCSATAGYCFGHPEDRNPDLRPKFDNSDDMQGYPWCEGMEPKKLKSETDFIHFDNVGAALLVVFQSMTVEGWTVIMYDVQDAFNLWFGTAYFVLLVFVTWAFLLNIALAVVDEARQDFQENENKQDKDKKSEEVEEIADAVLRGPEEMAENSPGGSGDAMSVDGPSGLWVDNIVVYFFNVVATSEVFMNFIMFIIIANVVTMMIDGKYPPDLHLKEFLKVSETIFLAIFCIEMVIMLGGHGPKSYWTNPVTAFDGVIVIASVISKAIGGGGPFTALRVLRLFRVLNKLAYLWPPVKVLMKAIIHTGVSLNYWLVLFLLMLYIFTLCSQEIFARSFYFVDEDFSATVPDVQGARLGQGALECPSDEFDGPMDCVPRAHFEMPIWAFITVFQVMTGENWNWIMYAGMRARGAGWALYFVFMILFGQTLILSLFLTMLMSKFDEVQDELEEEEKIKIQERKANKLAQRRKLMKKLTASKADGKGGLSPMISTDKVGEEVLDIGDSRVSEVPEQGTTDNVVVGKRPESSESRGRSKDSQKDQSKAKKVDDQNMDNEVDEEDDDLPDPRTSRNSSQIFQTPLQVAWARVTTPILGRPGWPNGYALFILHEESMIRKGCEQLLTQECKIKGSTVKIFDNLILVCILLSTICMAVDYPLRDPDDAVTILVRQADTIFAAIFIFEMAIKLLARGLVWAPNAYLKSGWNWLDGIVVIVSVMSMAGASNNGGLKTLRILRAFRPLRVIARNDNLKVVVQTIFASMPDLFTLVVVSMIFLLIFALMALSYLSGRMQYCDVGDSNVTFLQDKSQDFVTPLCLRPGPWTTLTDVDQDYSACPSPDGPHASTEIDAWMNSDPTDSCSSCGDRTLPWQRASADTPMCVGRCDPQKSWQHQPSLDLCPAQLTSIDQVPSECPDNRWLDLATETYGADFINAQTVGENFKQKHLRALVMPCGGYTVVNGVAEKPAGVVSCSEIFCPDFELRPDADDRRESCRNMCEENAVLNGDGNTPCQETCDRDGNDGELSAAEKADPHCEACLLECQARCECEEFCSEVHIKDAALCIEQGATWSEALSQNFNTIFTAILTLFEISTTEGWVDVMYAATDAHTDFFMQPVRDNQVVWAFFFFIYIFVFSMFFINLSVGVIVDKFMDLKAEASTTLAEDLSAGADAISVMSQAGFSSDVEITIECADQGLSETRKIKTLKGVGRFLLSAKLDNAFPKGATVTKKGKAILSTDGQDKWKKKWLQARKSLDGRGDKIYLLTNLQNLPANRRKVYDMISNRWFENVIMAAIILNTALMCLKWFPQPTDNWQDTLDDINYFFAAVFTVEAAIKLFALRLDYFRDPWNNFDCFCVVATLVGIVISASGSGANLAAITSVIRIFRIARLFRLLRFLKGLNKILMALLLSIPKLINVCMILMLLLILYSILGVNLFSTMKQGEFFNYHGSFRHSLWALITLFRASTGEAWNEIMHDLMKSERQLYREGEWCTPQDLFEDAMSNEYDKLKFKCLIDEPNMCSMGGWLPVIFWVSYTLVITFMIMNLVIAVILEGYEDGKPTAEGVVIDKCILLWRKYDPDQRMCLPIGKAIDFITEVCVATGVKGPMPNRQKTNATLSTSPPGNSQGVVSQGTGGSNTDYGASQSLKEFAGLPMKWVKNLDFEMDSENMVSFKQAAQSAIRIACFSENAESSKAVDLAEEKRQSSKQVELREHLAVMKLQEVWHNRQAKDKTPRSPEMSAKEMWDNRQKSKNALEGSSSPSPKTALRGDEMRETFSTPGVVEDSLLVESAGSIEVHSQPKPQDRGEDGSPGGPRQAGQGNLRDPPDAAVPHLTPPRAG